MLLEGKPVADKIKSEITDSVKECRSANSDLPKLAIMRAGSRPDDIAYESRIVKNCDELGIEVEVIVMEAKINMAGFMKTLEKLNEDAKIHGILIFRPLPDQLDLEVIRKAIKPEKDIDCISHASTEKIFSGDESGIPPCTPEAVIKILKFYEIELSGKNIVIINRSMVLGKPLAMLLLNENATVTICHSKTKELAEVVSRADIVVTGVGKPKFFKKEFFAKDSIVIDVGINFDEENNMCGDVDFSSVSEEVNSITPVPGGVEPVTSMVLLSHVIKAMKLQQAVKK